MRPHARTCDRMCVWPSPAPLHIGAGDRLFAHSARFHCPAHSSAAGPRQGACAVKRTHLAIKTQKRWRSSLGSSYRVEMPRAPSVSPHTQAKVRLCSCKSDWRRRVIVILFEIGLKTQMTMYPHVSTYTKVVQISLHAKWDLFKSIWSRSHT